MKWQLRAGVALASLAAAMVAPRPSIQDHGEASPGGPDSLHASLGFDLNEGAWAQPGPPPSRIIGVAPITVTPTIGPAFTISCMTCGVSEWNAGTVNTLGGGLFITGGTLTDGLGVIGQGLTVKSGGTLAVELASGTPGLQFSGPGGLEALVRFSGTQAVIALGGGLVINSGTLGDEWSAGSVTAVGAGCSIVTEVLECGGTAVPGEWLAGNVTAIAPSLLINSGTITTAEGSDGVRPAGTAFISYNTSAYCGTITLTDNAGGPLQLRAAGCNQGNNSFIFGEMQTITANGTLTARIHSQGFVGTAGTTTGFTAGLIAANAQNGAISVFTRLNLGNGSAYYIQRYSNPGAFNSNPIGNPVSDVSFGTDEWWRIVNNGTTLVWSVSRDQEVYTPIAIETISAFVGTLNYLGFALNALNFVNTGDVDLLVDHWKYQ